jgi:hypothetical protein
MVTTRDIVFSNSIVYRKEGVILNLRVKARTSVKQAVVLINLKVTLLIRTHKV